MGGRFNNRPRIFGGAENISQKKIIVKSLKIGFLFLIFSGAFFFRLKSRKKNRSQSESTRKNKK
jgi:hypothetical protein